MRNKVLINPHHHVTSLKISFHTQIPIYQNFFSSHFHLIDFKSASFVQNPSPSSHHGKTSIKLNRIKFLRISSKEKIKTSRDMKANSLHDLWVFICRFSGIWLHHDFINDWSEVDIMAEGRPVEESSVVCSRSKHSREARMPFIASISLICLLFRSHSTFIYGTLRYLTSLFPFP